MIDPTKKDAPWLLPRARSEKLRAGLYLVATPIGNLRDITVRALDTLAAANLVACEDTRVSGKLLKSYGISAKLQSYNDHSDEGKRAKLIEAAREKVVVLISDAGMPLVSDPGYKLVREATASGVYVTSLPGANAPLAALQLSSIPSDAFSFIGFLPSKAGARQAALKRWADVDSTLIAFETAPRLLKSLVDIADVMGTRRVAVVRELTKMYEEVRSGSALELIECYEAEGLPKGEIVLVIEPPLEVSYADADIEVMLMEALSEMGTKDAAAHVAEKSGRPKKELYNLALELAKNAG